MNILIFAPHQDDEVIGCGGTILHAVRRGHAVTVVYFYAGHSGVPTQVRKKGIRIREREAKAAGKILGLHKQFFLRCEDRSSRLPKNIIPTLVHIIRFLKPKRVYLPHSGERDREHRLTYDFGMEAMWLARSRYYPRLGRPLNTSPRVMSYEVWTPLSDVHIVELITDVFENKIKALKIYASQIGGLSLIESVTGLNRYRGSIGKPQPGYGEAFRIERP